VTRYKDFPPGWKHILVPVDSKANAKAGLAMYTPCRRRGEAIQTLAWRAVDWFGPGILPGRAVEWSPPEPGGRWDELRERLRRLVGDIDGHVVYERREQRPGVLLVLLRGGVTVAFVKLRLEPEDAFDTEATALDVVAKADHPSFSAPQLMGSGRLDGWTYLVSSPLPAGRHRMLPDGPQAALYADVARSLADLPRPDGIPDHWVPMHGDLTPWNLRSFGNGPWLLDWESAGWGPPHADEVLYRATASALGRPVGASPPSGIDEAVEHWRREVRERAAERAREGLPDEDIDEATLAALDTLAEARMAP
jgi:hypothetical protein